MEAVRPVFLIVMGASLLMVVWRLASGASPWAARLLKAGALMLAIGYVLVLPSYETGKIERVTLGAEFLNPATAITFHVVKMVSMNLGWLCFGTGLAMHAQLFGRRVRLPLRAPSAAALSIPSTSPHGSLHLRTDFQKRPAA